MEKERIHCSNLSIHVDIYIYIYRERERERERELGSNYTGYKFKPRYTIKKPSYEFSLLIFL